MQAACLDKAELCRPACPTERFEMNDRYLGVKGDEKNLQLR
jgi:hypothetical protein